MVREEIVFGDDECLCMRAYVEYRGVDTRQAQEQTRIIEPDRRTYEQGVDDADEDDIDSDATLIE